MEELERNLIDNILESEVHAMAASEDTINAEMEAEQ